MKKREEIKFNTISMKTHLTIDSAGRNSKVVVASKQTRGRL